MFEEMKKQIITQSLIAVSSMFLACVLIFNPEKIHIDTLRILGMVFLFYLALSLLAIYKVFLTYKIKALQESIAKTEAEIAEIEKQIEINNELLNEKK